LPLFSFSITISISQALESLCYISVCLPSLTPCTFNVWQKRFLRLAKILWMSATRSPFSSYVILVLGW
jgi:hypothetical protein